MLGGFDDPNFDEFLGFPNPRAHQNRVSGVPSKVLNTLTPMYMLCHVAVLREELRIQKKFRSDFVPTIEGPESDYVLAAVLEAPVREGRPTDYWISVGCWHVTPEWVDALLTRALSQRISVQRTCATELASGSGPPVWWG
jgi:hypothetical protein